MLSHDKCAEPAVQIWPDIMDKMFHVWSHFLFKRLTTFCTLARFCGLQWSNLIVAIFKTNSYCTLLLNRLHRDSLENYSIILFFNWQYHAKRHLPSVADNDSNGRPRHCDICSMTSHVIFVHDIWKIPMADSFFGFDTSLSVSYNQFLRE